MIEQITFNEVETKRLGLKYDGKPLRDLGEIVVLTGPNGAGKTRYLNCLKGAVSAYLDTKVPAEEEIKSRLKTVKKRLEELEQKTTKIDSKSRSISKLTQDAKTLNEYMTHVQSIRTSNSSENKKSIIHKLQLECDPNKSIENVFDLSPQKSRGMISNLSHELKANLSAAHCYLREKARALYAWKHPDHQTDPKLDEAFQKAQDFNILLETILNTKIGYELGTYRNYGTGEIIPTIFNRPFRDNELSEGQKLLLSWTILFFEFVKFPDDDDLIVIIEEPENYLHPDVCIKVINRLVKDLLPPNGQLWIATHSVPLIAFAGTDSLYLVKDGKIQYAGNKIDKAMDRLLGGENGRKQLQGMLSDAEEIGFFQYASECLIKPKPAKEKEQDKQQSFFLKIIEQKIQNDEKLKLLDFGAGKGRMACALSQNPDEKIISHLEYHAFEEIKDYNDDCKKNMQRFYGDVNVDEYFSNDFHSFTSPCKNIFDVVLLCNTLHEIEDTKWADLFGKIKRLLNENGILIIMEVQRMPVGELAHKKGFIVLDRYGIMDVFQEKERINDICFQEDDRIVAYEIPRDLLGNVTNKSLRKAFETTAERAMENVERIRNETREKTESKLGKEFAFYCLQYTNASMAKKRISEEN